MFPWQLIPDQIVIDQSKLTFEYRHILHTENIRTILLQDVYKVEVTYVLLIAALVINNSEVYKIPFLHRRDAVRAKQIITGLLVARRENINLEEVSPDTLVGKLVEIGRPHGH